MGLFFGFWVYSSGTVLIHHLSKTTYLLQDFFWIFMIWVPPTTPPLLLVKSVL